VPCPKTQQANLPVPFGALHMFSTLSFLMLNVKQEDMITNILIILILLNEKSNPTDYKVDVLTQRFLTAGGISR